MNQILTVSQVSCLLSVMLLWQKQEIFTTDAPRVSVSCQCGLITMISVRTSACDSTQPLQAGPATSHQIVHLPYLDMLPARLSATAFLLQLSRRVWCSVIMSPPPTCVVTRNVCLSPRQQQHRPSNNWLQLFLLRLQPTTGHEGERDGTLNFTFMLDICGQIRYWSTFYCYAIMFDKILVLKCSFLWLRSYQWHPLSLPHGIYWNISETNNSIQGSG